MMVAWKRIVTLQIKWGWKGIPAVAQWVKYTGCSCGLDSAPVPGSLIFCGMAKKKKKKDRKGKMFEEYVWVEFFLINTSLLSENIIGKNLSGILQNLYALKNLKYYLFTVLY